MHPNPPSQPHTLHKSKTPIRFFHWSIIISSSYTKRHNCYFRVFRHTTNISKPCNTCPHSCLTCFSMSHNHIFFHIPPRDDRRTATASPLFRGVRRSRGVCIRKQIPKVLISGSDIRAGSASGIHTPPLPWHPFQKGTLPPCSQYPHTVSIAIICYALIYEGLSVPMRHTILLTPH